MVLLCLGPSIPLELLFTLLLMSQNLACGAMTCGTLMGCPGPHSLFSWQVALWQLPWNQKRSEKSPEVQAGSSPPGFRAQAPTSSSGVWLPWITG